MRRINLCLSRLAAPALALVFLLGWGCVRKALAQGCTGFMTPEYSTYTNYSSDGTYIYTSVTVSGTTNGTCPEYCDCEGIVHTPGAYNVIGNAGGWGYGAPVRWNYGLNYTNNQKLAATVGSQYTFASAGQIMCSAAGALYATWPPTLIGLRIAVTTYKYQSVKGGVCTYGVFCGQNQYTCGGAMLQALAPCPSQYIITKWLVVRIGTNSTCVPVGRGVEQNTPATCQ
ncbi:MAG: hypothetical protein ACRD2O_14185 [Terriglobia bacterium]